MMHRIKTRILSFFQCEPEKDNTNTEWKLTCCGFPIDFSRAMHIAEQDQEIFYETVCRRCGREFDIYVFPAIGQSEAGQGQTTRRKR